MSDFEIVATVTATARTGRRAWTLGRLSFSLTHSNYPPTGPWRFCVFHLCPHVGFQTERLFCSHGLCRLSKIEEQNRPTDLFSPKMSVFFFFFFFFPLFFLFSCFLFSPFFKLFTFF